MTELRYCRPCILPHTRPNLSFDDAGNCNCATGETKARGDWSEREAQFRRLVEATIALSRPYDCVIPVSRGKDSTWQWSQRLSTAFSRSPTAGSERYGVTNGTTAEDWISDDLTAQDLAPYGFWAEVYETGILRPPWDGRWRARRIR